jgi:hypothetical protein
MKVGSGFRGMGRHFRQSKRTAAVGLGKPTFAGMRRNGGDALEAAITPTHRMSPI